MKRLLMAALTGLAIALSAVLPARAETVTIAVNASAFPLTDNIMFPARAAGRLALKCVNPTTNGAATLTYGTFTVIIQPGQSWGDAAPNAMPGWIPSGVVTATGTSTQTLQCYDTYLN